MTNNKPTKDQFIAYECIKKSGHFNMITEWTLACRAAGLKPDTYFDIIENYSELKKEYLGK